MKNLLLACLLVAGTANAAEWGRLPATPLPDPAAAGPAHHSRVFVGETTIRNGQAALDIPLDAEGDAFLVVFDERPVAARAAEGRDLPNRPFRNPVLQSMDVPAVGARIDLDSLGRGAHVVNLETARRDGRLQYAVMLPENAAEMTVTLAPLAPRAGETVTVSAELPANAADVTARIRGAGKVTLRDDGRNGDREANDGIYTATFTAPRSKGLRETVVRVDASGELEDGTPFRRTATATAMVSHSVIRLAAGDIDIDADALRVSLPPGKGRYRIEAIYGADGETLAWARQELDGGKPVAELPRPEAAHAADRVIIRVLDRETLALADEIALDLEPLQSDRPDYRPATPRLPDSKAKAAQRHGAER